MKLLVISNNYIIKKDGKCYCEPNFYHILKRFSYMGEISLCALPREEASTYIELDFVLPENVYYIKKARVLPLLSNCKVLKKAVAGCDIVIGYNPCVNAEAALLYTRRYGKKYMTYLVACAWGSLWYHSLFGKLSAPLRFLSVRVATKMSDYVLYVTEKFLQGRYPNSRINTGCSDVYISMPEESVLSARLQRIQSMNERSYKKIATIGSVEVRYKGQEYVIKALGRLKREGKCAFEYYLIGGGDSRYLKKIAEDNGVADRVFFMGQQPFEKIPEILDGMDIYIQPSLTEGLPRSIVEAMSRGLTCYGSRVGGIPELLEHEFTFEKKSVGQIAQCLGSITPAILHEQSVRNAKKATEYDNLTLDSKRKEFFDTVMSDIKIRDNYGL